MISRRPIVNNRLHVAGYILQSGDPAQVTNAQAEPSALAFDVFDDFPLERLVGKHLTFFTYHPALLQSPPPLNRQQCVVWVSNSVDIDATKLHSLMLLRTKGYSIALDDFVLNPHTETLVGYAGIIGISPEDLTPEQLSETIEYVSMFGITLLAKNIHHYAMFNHCKLVGFELFEGDFLTKADMDNEQLTADAEHRLIETMAALHDANAPLDKIERILARDRHLSQKVLSIVNSAATGIVREVESLRQAIMLIGLDKLKNIANLLILSNIKHKPHELTVIALTRAHMCEALALVMNNRARCDSYFTAGLVSTLDAFLDAPLPELLEKIGLPINMVNAILHKEGNEGALLKTVKAYEQAQWNLLDWEYLNAHRLDAETINRCYLESLEKVTTMMHTLGVNPEH